MLPAPCEAFLKEEGTTIVDAADEYYDDYYASFFLDPDGLKPEGMKHGEHHAKAHEEARPSHLKVVCPHRAEADSNIKGSAGVQSELV